MSSNVIENAKELFVNYVLIYNEKSASFKRTKKKWKHKLKGLFPISVQDLSENWLKERSPDGLIVMGGDGTINSTANIILNSGLDIPMGIIPGGGGNDFYQRQVGRCQEDNGSGITVHEVFELEYPNNIQKRCAVNTVEWGIGALVTEKRENNEGRFLTGMLKYFYLVIKSLFEFNSWKATIRIDGKDMEFDDLSSVVVGFGSSTMGGGYIMFPEMMAPTAMSIMTVGVVLGGIIMGLVYSVINSAIPGEGARKGLNYGIMVWLLAGLTLPIMMMGFAPAYLWIAELINGLITYSIAGAVLAIIYGKL